MKRETSMLIGVTLCVAASAVWSLAPALHGGILSNMDDDVYMATAEQCGGLTAKGLHWAFTETQPYYHPLPRLTHLAAYNFCGTNPFGHHAVNVALHALNSILVVALAWTICRNAAGAGITGMLFAVHPLQAESVAWMSGRTQLICGALMIGCALAYVQTAGTRSRWRWLPGALFLLGWLAKPIVVTMPLVLLVLDWYPLRRHEKVGWRKLIREKLWLFAASAAFAGITLLFATHGKLLATAHRLGLVERIWIAERGALFYLWKLVWPFWFSPIYPLDERLLLGHLSFAEPALLLAVLCAVAWWTRRRCPAATAAWLAFLAILLPVSGLTQFGTQWVANRHAYVAIVPLLLAVAGGWVWIDQRVSIPCRVGMIVLGAGIAFSLAVKTRETAQMWRDDEILWSNVLRWYPDYAFANWKYAVATAARQDFATALPYAARLLHEQPDNCEVRGLTGLAHLQTGNYQEAVRILEPLVQTNLWLPAARYNLACAYVRLGSNDVAVALLRELIAREPRYADLVRHDSDLPAIVAEAIP
jgi:protein O-mannosyl-transferase